ARSFVGTEGYIPPEGHNSAQADIYSLGKVLYEACMGKDRQDFPDPMTRIRETADSEAMLEMNAILLKACAANLRDRYQSAEEMNADLALLQSGQSVRRKQAMERTLSKLKRAGVGIGIVTVIAVAAFLYQSRETRTVRKLAMENLRL